MAPRQNPAPQTVEDPFLPNDYERPKSGGNFLKLKNGVQVDRNTIVTTVRILARPVTGEVGWQDDGGQKTPIRKHTLAEFEPGEVLVDKDNRISHFWAVPVWNYREHRVQVFEITQVGILDGLEGLIKNPKWGNPLHYDIVITRAEKNTKITYSVQADPKAPLDAEAQAAWAPLAAHGFDLNCLFEGLDPFTLEGGNGNGSARDAAAGAASPIKRFFAVLDEAVVGGLYEKGIKADNEDGRTARRKLLSALLEVKVEDPKTLTADQWAQACEALKRVIEKNKPADEDITF